MARTRLGAKGEEEEEEAGNNPGRRKSADLGRLTSMDKGDKMGSGKKLPDSDNSSVVDD